jgi:N-acyl homoserine lactone hydrolase
MIPACSRLFLLLISSPLVALAQPASTARPDAGLRLYVLDGGVLESDPSRYELTDEDVETSALSIASYLVVHPRGILVWDAGAVADDERISSPGGRVQRLVRTDGQERFVTLGPSLESQLAAIGYEPRDVTHLALSHYHWDHTANANRFAHASWLVRAVERGAMFADEPPGGTRPTTYAALRGSAIVLIDEDEHDVFGDGTVVIKSAPGHTPGHQVLFVQLARTGGVVLSGDLYHYAAERRLGRLPVFEFDPAATEMSRDDVEDFLSRHAAELWIQHDLTAHRALRKAPEYYD